MVAESQPSRIGIRSRLARQVQRVRATRWWPWVRWPLAAAVGVFTLLVLTFVFLYFTVKLPKNPPELASSVVLDAQGREVAVLAKDQLRVEVRLDQMAPVVPDALLSSEDRRFYEHSGIDPVGLLRAVVNDLRGGATQGGSTITQQLVKNSYLDGDRSLWRKMKEAVLAIKLERRDDKASILERYLNVVYFGRGAYGIEAAARTYFNESAAQLNAPQAALLVGLLRAPESADPATNPAEAKRRRDTVLQDMVENHKLSAADADAAKAAPLGATDLKHPVSLTAGVAAHFVEWVRQQAVQQLGAQAVYGAGLRIHTTLDLDAQRAAEQAVSSVLTDPNDPQAALVALDRDGNIKAYVGGRDYNTLQVDLARGKDGGGSGRQPGSAFKPFTLAAALEQKTALDTMFPAPPTITLDTGSGPWTVNNFNNEGFGITDLTTATANSINTVYAQLMLQTGPKNVSDLAHHAGIVSPLEPNPSLTLGTDEVSPMELADSYLTFAREGEHVPTVAITSIEDAHGKVVYRAPATAPQRVMQQGTAQAVSYALQRVITSGTGTAAQLDRPVAGKTGTTENFGDAWFSGYTPNYVATVWMGFPDGREHEMTDVHGIAVSGGTLPAQIWHAFMQQALVNVPRVDFTPPPDDLLHGKGTSGPTLTVDPPAIDPGGTVTVSGDGFQRCAVSWSVLVDDGSTSSPETGSNAEHRSAQVTTHPAIGPGAHQVQAVCDDGTGSHAIASTTLVINGGSTSTTPPSSPGPSTTTNSTATTTTTAPKRTTTTTSTTATTVPVTSTTAGAATTSTTAPGG